jgi:hypothetical protein
MFLCMLTICKLHCRHYGKQMRQPFNENGALRYGTGIQSLKRCQCIVSAQNSAGILELSVRARNRVGIKLSYRPARLQTLVESIPWNQFKNTASKANVHYSVYYLLDISARNDLN